MVNTTVFASKRMPIWVTTPFTVSPSTIKSSAACWKISKLAWFSKVARIAALKRTRSACARVARTAAPLREFKIRN